MDTLGRDEELRTLQAYLDKPAESVTALVLAGEAGIGKSTLWLAGVESARERGLRVLSSRPGEVDVGVAHAALGDLLEAALPDVLPELAGPRRRALETALLLGDGPDEPVDGRTLAVAVRNVLQLLAERGPILLAIDDVQWLDASSANALAFALRRLPDQGIRLLLTHRTTSGNLSTELERALDDRNVERLRVGPLSPGALHAILRDRLDRVFARPTLLRLHEASGGNAFFALELARALPTDVDHTQPLPVPATLEALVRARLDVLPDATRATLLLACAHGRIQPTQLDGDALDPAFAGGVIEVAEGVIRFTHPLLASVLYQGAPPEARRSAHARLATLADDQVARARHHALASSGPDAAIAAELEEAGALAIARGAPIVAAELYEHAVRVTAPSATDDVQRRAILAAHAHMAAGEGARPREIASELVATTSAGPERAEVLMLLAELEPADRSLTLLLDALREATGDPSLQAAIHQQLAENGRVIEGISWSEQHARAALQLGEALRDDGIRVGALSKLALLRFNVGDAEAPELAGQAVALAVALDDPELLNEAHRSLAHVLVWSAELERARALLENLDRMWSDRDERWSAHARWYLSVVELQAGRWSLAEAHAEHARVVMTQYAAELPPSLLPLALIAVHRGELERARELAESATALAVEMGARLPALKSIRGLVALWSGDPAEALPWFEEADELATEIGMLEPVMLLWRADHVEALLALGQATEAGRLLDDWEADAMRLGRGWVLAHVGRCRGLAAAAAGDVETAIVLLAEAVGAHERVGDPFGRARALLALGVVRRRARQKRPAREAIEAALEGFETLGAAGWAETARAELGQIGGRTRAEGLTAAEQRVAALVAEGRTNREVAAALFLAERTVASHLSRVYAKLGVRSRTELARKLQTF
jgi:DNA-binding CsgD family transcriptional regulator